MFTKVLEHKFDIHVDARILPKVPNPWGYRRPAFVLFLKYITIIFWTKRPIQKKLGGFPYYFNIVKDYSNCLMLCKHDSKGDRVVVNPSINAFRSQLINLQ